MIHVCRVCDIKAGGLIRVHGLDECDWPEPDLCPTCAASPTKVAEHDADEHKAIMDALEKARRQVASIIAKEREGESVQGLMEFRMR